MAWASASGQPVAMAPISVQLKLPTEPVGDVQATAAASLGVVNIIAVMIALFNLVTALTSGDTARIVAAIQALIKAITGQ